jgi:hypothetical protein
MYASHYLYLSFSLYLSSLCHFFCQFLLFNFLIFLFLSTSLRRNFCREIFYNNKVKLISGTLTVNVSVLLLSLASPDESSLVSFTSCFQLSIRKLQYQCRFILKPFLYPYFSPEIRSWIFAATTMVRSETEICKSIAIWLFECNTSSWRYLAARHVFHNAWWF